MGSRGTSTVLAWRLRFQRSVRELGPQCKAAVFLGHGHVHKNELSFPAANIDSFHSGS